MQVVFYMRFYVFVSSYFNRVSNKSRQTKENSDTPTETCYEQEACNKRILEMNVIIMGRKYDLFGNVLKISHTYKTPLD